MTKLQTRSLLVVVLALVSVGLLVVGRVPALEPVWRVVELPLFTIQRAVSGLWEGASGNLQADPAVEELQQRLAELEAENQQLRTENLQLKENENEIRIISGLVNYAQSQPEAKYLAATKIGSDTSPFLTYVIFDKGSDDGVTRGMPVVTGEGLVGRVVEVSATACKVLLITDPASAVATRLQKSREEGMVVGQVGGGLEMQFITQQAKIETGEVVLTSGLAGAYPAGIVVGYVSGVEQLNFEVLQKAVLAPAVDFTKLDIVLIITNFQPADISPFFQATPTPLAPAQP
ncbi:MAG: rod shape-determining protein MreC [Anaerolineales bacterium]